MEFSQKFLRSVFFLIKKFYELRFSALLELDTINYNKIEKRYICIYIIKSKRSKKVSPLMDIYNDFETLKLFSKSDIQYISYYAGKFSEMIKNETKCK